MVVFAQKHYQMKKRSNVLLLRFQRREWDLNPRMTVLQTVALGHLAIPPLCLVAGQSLHEYGRSVKIKNEFLLLLFSGCRVVTALDTTPRALYHVLI